KVNGLWVMGHMIVVKEAFRVSSPAARGRVAPVSGTRMQQTTGSMPFQLHVEEERTHWLYCSIIGALKEENDVKSFQEKFLKSGPLPFQLTDCGGRLLILTFTDKQTKECALAGGMALQPWFRWLKPWSNECQPGVIRDAWLKCTGLPHQLWNQENLARVGKIWGEVLPGNHVLRIMAMAFGWVKWALGCMSRVQPVIFFGDRKQTGVEEPGLSSQRSFVSESRMSNGEREDAGIVADSGSLVAAGLGSKVMDTCHVGMTDERINEGGFVDLPGGESTTRAINSRVQRNLIGAQSGVVVGQEAQAGMASTFCPRVQNGSARSTIASQENITRLGMQGRLLRKPLSDPSMAATGVRAARGATLKMKRKGVLVRAAAEALARGQLNRVSQRATELLEEASSTWELGKTLGIVADASDGEVI
ncbi:hypothetical protein Dimus_004105, partial [Dionaea muscipula]